MCMATDKLINTLALGRLIGDLSEQPDSQAFWLYLSATPFWSGVNQRSVGGVCPSTTGTDIITTTITTQCTYVLPSVISNQTPLT